MPKELTLNTQRPAFLAKPGHTTGTSAFGAGLGDSTPLPALSMRGKTWRFRLGGNEVSTKSGELDVILIAARPYTSKRYYASDYTGEDTTLPTCWSIDGTTPLAPEPVSPSCKTCELNAWGSATKGTRRGKACQDYKRLVVWPLFRNVSQQMILDLPPMSLRAPRGSELMMLREFVRACEKHDVDPTTYVVRLAFTEAEFPQVTFTPQRFVTEDEYRRVTEMIEDPDTDEVLFGNEPLQAAAEDGDDTSTDPRADERKELRAKPSLVDVPFDSPNDRSVDTPKRRGRPPARAAARENADQDETGDETGDADSFGSRKGKRTKVDRSFPLPPADQEDVNEDVNSDVDDALAELDALLGK